MSVVRYYEIVNEDENEILGIYDTYDKAVAASESAFERYENVVIREQKEDREDEGTDQ